MGFYPLETKSDSENCKSGWAFPNRKKMRLFTFILILEPNACPYCGKGEMHIIMSFGANAPPSHNVLNALKNNILKQYVSSTR